jgi:hypothetical protein
MSSRKSLRLEGVSFILVYVRAAVRPHMDTMSPRNGHSWQMGSFLDTGKYLAVGLGSGPFGASLDLGVFVLSYRWPFFDGLGYGMVDGMRG